MEKYQRIEQVELLVHIPTSRDENGMITKVGMVQFITPEGHIMWMGEEKFFEAYEKI